MHVIHYGSHRSARQCPKCRGSLLRIKRRWLDRAISVMFVPMHRYRCEQLGCNWEGRLMVEGSTQTPQPLLRVLTNEKLRRTEPAFHGAKTTHVP
jgi:hypothetical protein